MNQYLTGQDVLRNPNGSSISGFNCRIDGHSYLDTFQYPHERTDAERHAGWELADRMIADGRLFFVHNFHSLTCEKGHAFRYGGTWACNTCNSDHLDAPWWKIKVLKDGNAWCCIGLEFENLQESDCYAFGDTRDEAIANYGALMVAMAVKQK